jgi:hypothetical protein
LRETDIEGRGGYLGESSEEGAGVLLVWVEEEVVDGFSDEIERTL